MTTFKTLKTAYPFIKFPFVVSPPMLGASSPRLAVEVSRAGGLGFIAGGTNPEKLDEMLDEATTLLKSTPTNSINEAQGALPIGVGFQLFNSPLDALAKVIAKHTPTAVWLFAPKIETEPELWSRKIRDLTKGKTQIWIQVGSVGEALRSLSLADPDVLVMQGNDAGGHGLHQSASIISLIPEVLDSLSSAGRSDIPVLAAGGIAESRGFAAALALGASGAVMGTRFLASKESAIAHGWKQEILRTQDGGIFTSRSTLCDRLKETKGWPKQYDGRAIRNKGQEDEEAGMPDEQNIQLYKEELKQGEAAWGPHGRMVTYAGTGVGLIKGIQPAESIVNEILYGTKCAFEAVAEGLDNHMACSML